MRPLGEHCSPTVSELLIRLTSRTFRVLGTASPSKIAIDETAAKISGEWSWVYAAIDVETKLILDVELFGQHSTGSAAAFLHGLRKKHDLSVAELPVDRFGYPTAPYLSRVERSSELYRPKPHEKVVSTLEVRVGRIHTSLVAQSGERTRTVIERFVQHYNH